MIDKPLKEGIEVPYLYLRKANFNQPVEIVIGRGKGECETIRLTPSQLRRLALDSTAFSIMSDIISSETSRTADGT